MRVSRRTKTSNPHRWCMDQHFRKPTLSLISRKGVSLRLSCSELLVASYFISHPPWANTDILFHDGLMNLALTYLSSTCARKIYLGRLLCAAFLVVSYFLWSSEIWPTRMWLSGCHIMSSFPPLCPWENYATTSSQLVHSSSCTILLPKCLLSVFQITAGSE